MTLFNHQTFNTLFLLKIEQLTFYPTLLFKNFKKKKEIAAPPNNFSATSPQYIIRYFKHSQFNVRYILFSMLDK